MYLISYDLKSAEADYEAMYSAIQALGASLRVLDSTWIVDPPHDVGEDDIATRLRGIIHAGDRFIVVHIDNRRQGWLSRNMWDWMREHDENLRGNS